MRFFASFAVLAVMAAVLTISAPTPARAQAPGCQTIEVSGARGRQVLLYSLTDVTTPAGSATRDQMAGVTSAMECAQLPNYLMVQVDGERWLVPRTQMNVAAEIELPPCSSREYASQSQRNASSSGLGGAACQ